MFGFLEELSQISDIPFNVINGKFKICLLGENLVYLSNFIKVLSYSQEKMSFKVKNNVINIEGQNLQISQISPKEIILKGNILNIGLERSVKK